MLQLKVLVGELLTVDGAAAGAVVVGEVPALGMSQLEQPTDKERSLGS